jgi:hypothetical protein
MPTLNTCTGRVIVASSFKSVFPSGTSNITEDPPGNYAQCSACRRPFKRKVPIDQLILYKEWATTGFIVAEEE